MVNLETLTVQSLRYYQLGRLRMAARIAVPVLPISAVCLLEPAGREACACCAVLLLLVSVWLRFSSRAGVESVTTGILAGAAPLAATLVLTWVDPGCATAGLLSFCTGFSLVVGAAAGTIVALRERNSSSPLSHWQLTLGVALLTASLGCLRLGLASLAGVAVGMLVGRISAGAASANS